MTRKVLKGPSDEEGSEGTNNVDVCRRDSGKSQEEGFIFSIGVFGSCLCDWNRMSQEGIM